MTKPNKYTNENVGLFKKVTPPFTTKNKKQESISDLVMLTNTENDSVNSNTNHEVKDGIVQNTIFNRCIEDTATAMVVNNRFTTKSTFNIRPEGKQIP